MNKKNCEYIVNRDLVTILGILLHKIKAQSVFDFYFLFEKKRKNT